MASVDVSGGGAAAAFISGYYISAYDTSDHNITAPLAVETLEFNTTVISSGISIQGANDSDIVFTTAGIFNIQFSCQVLNSSVQNHEFYLWLCKNGAPEAYTNSIVTIPSTHGGIDGHFIAAWNFVIQAAPGDSYQLCWSGNNTAISIETIASPAAPIPVSPSAILTVTQV